MKKSYPIVAIAITGISLAFIYSQVVVDDPLERFKQLDRKFYLTGNVKADFDLRDDAYLLKVRWYEHNESQPQSITVNGRKFSANTWPFTKRSKNCCRHYIHIPREALKKGANTVEAVFPEPYPSYVSLTVRNYRECISGIYILFPDSTEFPRYKIPAGTFLPVNILAVLLSLLAWSLINRADLKQSEVLFYVCRYARILLVFVFTLLISTCISTVLGYGIALGPGLFWGPVFIILGLSVVEASKLLRSTAQAELRYQPSTGFWLTKTGFNVQTGSLFLVLIILVNLWVYWPSFSHIFRHDEWAFFFVSRHTPPGLGFFFKHIDWQLCLPYDRLIFRPLHHAMLAANRVIFDTNYVGPHIITFSKHIIATLCLWWLMWQYKPTWLSALFALLFSVLLVHIDPVIWPHLDSHITTTIFLILAIIIFRKTVYDQIRPVKGFVLTGVLLLLAMLATEIAVLMPLVFFGSYWLILRGQGQPATGKKDRAAWWVLLLPLLTYMLFYGVHLYYAYPNLRMTVESNFIGCVRPLINVGGILFALLSGLFLPFLTGFGFAEKVFFHFNNFTLVIIVGLLFLCIKTHKRSFRWEAKHITFPLLIIICLLTFISFGRAWYIDARLLSENQLATHYLYCPSAMTILALYLLVDLDKLAKSRLLGRVFVSIILLLILGHAFQSHGCAVSIRQRLLPLKRYFDSVNHFVSQKREEPDFSFRMLDRPPNVGALHWYYETAIDGLFHRFIDNEQPKYLLEYDYGKRELRYSLYDKENLQRLSRLRMLAKDFLDPDIPVNSPDKPDFVNSIGVKFRRVHGPQYDFLIGIYEVTQKQWTDVMGYNPSTFTDPDRPVENVSYQMVKEFIDRLNKMEGTDSYRLPTEAEYSMLAHMAMADIHQHGRDITEYAWLEPTAVQMTHPVGRLQPMPPGIYDLIGNVWEWTDQLIYYHKKVKPFADSPHLCFGSSWREGNILQTNYPVDYRHSNLGFRLAKGIRK